MLLLGEESEKISNMFWIRGERSVYFNIRGEGSVIQASLRGRKCNLLKKKVPKLGVYKTHTHDIYSNHLR